MGEGQDTKKKEKIMIIITENFSVDMNEYPPGTKFFLNGRIELPKEYRDREKKMERVIHKLNQKIEQNFLTRLYYKMIKRL